MSFEPYAGEFPSRAAVLAKIGASDSDTVFPSSVSLFRNDGVPGPSLQQPGAAVVIDTRRGDPDINFVLPFVNPEGRQVWTPYPFAFTNPRVLRGRKLGQATYAMQLRMRGGPGAVAVFEMNGEPGTGSLVHCSLRRSLACRLGMTITLPWSDPG